MVLLAYMQVVREVNINVLRTVPACKNRVKTV